MTITAKHSGTCKLCGALFMQGQKIDWSKETGARHTEGTCPFPPKDAAAPKQPPAPPAAKQQEDPIARIAAYLDKLPPLDALRIAGDVLIRQHARVESAFRRPARSAA